MQVCHVAQKLLPKWKILIKAVQKQGPHFQRQHFALTKHLLHLHQKQISFNFLDQVSLTGTAHVAHSTFSGHFQVTLRSDSQNRIDFSKPVIFRCGHAVIILVVLTEQGHKLSKAALMIKWECPLEKGCLLEGGCPIKLLLTVFLILLNSDLISICFHTTDIWFV